MTREDWDALEPAEKYACIERLRAAASYPAMAADLHSLRLCCMEHGWDSVGDPVVWLTRRLTNLTCERDEARAEIERLRAERDALAARWPDTLVAGDLLTKAERERDEARALLTAVAQSGVAWRTHGPRGYYVVQIDNNVWDAVQKIGGAQ